MNKKIKHLAFVVAGLMSLFGTSANAQTGIDPNFTGSCVGNNVGQLVRTLSLQFSCGVRRYQCYSNENSPRINEATFESIGSFSHTIDLGIGDAVRIPVLAGETYRFQTGNNHIGQDNTFGPQGNPVIPFAGWCQVVDQQFAGIGVVPPGAGSATGQADTTFNSLRAFNPGIIILDEANSTIVATRGNSAGMGDYSFITYTPTTNTTLRVILAEQINTTCYLNSQQEVLVSLTVSIPTPLIDLTVQPSLENFFQYLPVAQNTGCNNMFNFQANVLNLRGNRIPLNSITLTGTQSSNVNGVDVVSTTQTTIPGGSINTNDILTGGPWLMPYTLVTGNLLPGFDDYGLDLIHIPQHISYIELGAALSGYNAGVDVPTSCTNLFHVFAQGGATTGMVDPFGPEAILEQSSVGIFGEYADSYETPEEAAITNGTGTGAEDDNNLVHLNQEAALTGGNLFDFNAALFGGALNLNPLATKYTFRYTVASTAGTDANPLNNTASVVLNVNDSAYSKVDAMRLFNGTLSPRNSDLHLDIAPHATTGAGQAGAYTGPVNVTDLDANTFEITNTVAPLYDPQETDFAPGGVQIPNAIGTRFRLYEQDTLTSISFVLNYVPNFSANNPAEWPTVDIWGVIDPDFAGGSDFLISTHGVGNGNVNNYTVNYDGDEVYVRLKRVPFFPQNQYNTVNVAGVAHRFSQATTSTTIGAFGGNQAAADDQIYGRFLVPHNEPSPKLRTYTPVAGEALNPNIDAQNLRSSSTAVGHRATVANTFLAAAVQDQNNSGIVADVVNETPISYLGDSLGTDGLVLRGGRTTDEVPFNNTLYDGANCNNPVDYIITITNNKQNPLVGNQNDTRNMELAVVESKSNLENWNAIEFVPQVIAGSSGNNTTLVAGTAAMINAAGGVANPFAAATDNVRLMYLGRDRQIARDDRTAVLNENSGLGQTVRNYDLAISANFGRRKVLAITNASSYNAATNTYTFRGCQTTNPVAFRPNILNGANIGGNTTRVRWYDRTAYDGWILFNAAAGPAGGYGNITAMPTIPAAGPITGKPTTLQTSDGINNDGTFSPNPAIYFANPLLDSTVFVFTCEADVAVVNLYNYVYHESYGGNETGNPSVGDEIPDQVGVINTKQKVFAGTNELGDAATSIMGQHLTTPSHEDVDSDDAVEGYWPMPVETPQVNRTYGGNIIKQKVYVRYVLRSLPTANIGTTPAITLCGNGTFVPTAQPASSAGSTFTWTAISAPVNAIISGANSYTPTFTASINATAIAPVTTTYVMTETNAAGCTNTNQIVITVNPIIDANQYVAPDQTVCAGTTINLGISTITTATYAWTSVPAGAVFSPSAGFPNPVVTPTANTTYILTMTNSYGCSSSADVWVTSVASPAVTPINVTDALGFYPDIYCENTTAQLSAPAGAVSYQWSASIANSEFTGGIANTPTATFRPLYDKAYVGMNSGITPTYEPTYIATYTVVATGANGCTARNSIAVTVGRAPAGAVSEDKVICARSSDPNDEVFLGATTPQVDGTLYDWQPASLLNQAGSNNPRTFLATNNTVAPGLYNFGLTQTVISTQCYRTNTVKVFLEPAKAYTGPNQTTCAGEEVELGGASTAGSTYSWTSTPAGFASTASNPRVSPNVTTTYTLTETFTAGVNSCSKSASVVVTVNPFSTQAPVVSVAPSATFCEGGQATLTASGAPGAISYTWFRNGIVVPGNSSSIVVNLPGQYTVSAINGPGCSSPASAGTTIVVNALPTANFTDNDADNITCDAAAGIELSATATTGATYQWYVGGVAIPGATASTYKVTATGDYSVQVMLNGCSNNSLATTYTVNNLVSQPTVSSNSTCAPATLTVTNVVPGAVYSWSNGIVGQSSVTVANGGSYTVTVNLSGCTNASNPVSVGSAPIVSISADNTSYCVGGTASVLTANSTPSNVTYQWKKGNANLGTASTQTANGSGDYRVVVSDAGCTATSNTITITELPRPSAPDIQIVNGNLVAVGANTVEWTKDGAPAGTGISIPFTGTAEYCVVAVNGNCKSTPSCRRVTVGIQDAANNLFTVYPVPATDMITIELAGTPSVETVASLINTNGQLVKNVVLSSKNNKIDVSSLAKGVYNLKVVSGDQVVIKKVVLQ